MEVGQDYAYLHPTIGWLNQGKVGTIVEILDSGTSGSADYGEHKCIVIEFSVPENDIAVLRRMSFSAELFESQFKPYV
jgi:hypothetical protein